MVLLIDDLADFHREFEKGFKATGVGLEIKCFEKVAELSAEIKRLSEANQIERLKGLIIDLSNSKEEDASKTFSVTEIIDDSFRNNSIPIFIHSAYLEYYESYKEFGTVLKIKKSPDSVREICNLFKLMNESGFLDVFSISGTLQKTLHSKIHDAFTEQFKGSEISQIIESIRHASSSAESFKSRTQETFTRMAIRALYQNAISARKVAPSDKIEEIRVNAIEHFYRRTSDFLVWTGDIFERDADKSQVVILTPRCDINNNACYDRFLVCRVLPLEGKAKKEIAKDARGYLTDNPKTSGIKSRYLVPVPSFSGGKVDLTDYFILNRTAFEGENSEYKYRISLSDELTNEIVRKFSSFLLRGGISATDEAEAAFYAE